MMLDNERRAWLRSGTETRTPTVGALPKRVKDQMDDVEQLSEGPEECPEYMALVDDVMAELIEHLPYPEKRSIAQRLACLKGRYEATEAGWVYYVMPRGDHERRAKRAMQVCIQRILKELRSREGGPRS